MAAKKFKSALARVASRSNLEAAFSYIYSKASPRSKQTSGVDNQSLIDFHARKDFFLADLSTQLLKKQFNFSKLSPHFIKKDNGKERVICVPTVRDRIVQRALLDYLTLKYQSKVSNSVSYGFVSDRGVDEAAKESCRLRKHKPWVFKTDITAFFDRVPRAVLKARLRKLVNEPSLIPLLESAIDCEVFVESEFTLQRLAKLGIQSGLGIRQGMPMSPFLSNVMLNKFDQAVIAEDYSAVRYADDLIFFASSQDECVKMHAFCEAKLLVEGFSIPAIGAKSKSEFYSPGQSAEFLGLSLVQCSDKSYRLEVSQDQMNHIRTELFKLTDLGYLQKLNIDFFKFGQSLNSRIGGYVNAYAMCSNLKHFEKKMEVMRKKIYSTVLANLGVVPAALPVNAKRFFRLE